ncbi:SPOR domain-containing protein [Helicobacter anatolicus]|uniref:SPOR domain-containing protein n=1 Tax=Helicobacter anatolicus TaxID=2905874 RepID=UPI001E641AE6|nr:SPOR domain-containing protein [Helicobacter anatolicus]MCE3039510.1 SPOR domain-containing protein [Helicobacter anatolicus]
MEEKDFNEMLLESSKQSQKTKNIIIGIVAIIAVLIAVLLIWSFTKSDHKLENTEQSYNTNTTMPQEQENTDFLDQNFGNLTDTDMAETSLDKFVDDIKQTNQQEENLHNMQQAAQSLDTTIPSQDIMPNTVQVSQDNNVSSKLATQKNIEKAISAKQTMKPVKKPTKKFSQIIPEQATKGSYLQVGVFKSMPNKKLQALLEQHPFKILDIEIDNQKATKYLIGPFQTRKEANQYKKAHNSLKDSIYFEVK